MKNEATREVFWNVSHPLNQVVMYGLFALSLVVFIYGIYSRFSFWRGGKTRSLPSFPGIKDLALGFLEVASQRRVSRGKPGGTYHIFVYLGFLSLLAITTAVFLDYDLGIPIFRGKVYLILTLLSDVLGAAFFFALILLLRRRVSGSSKHLSSSAGDYYFLLTLLLLIFQGFVLEALRISAIPDPWSHWSPVGLAMSHLFWPLSDTGKQTLHFGMWWFHAVTFFVWFALIPYTKAFHIISSSLCLATSKPSARSGVSYEGDVEQLMEEALSSSDEDIRFGVKTISDTTWRQRLEFDGCTACGRCEEVCPAWMSGKVLSPKLLMVAMKRYTELLNDAGLDQKLRTCLDNVQGKEDETYFRDTETLDFANSKICGDLIDEEVFWSCTTCRACVEACPVGINHVDFIVDVRRSETLLESAAPREAQGMLRSLESKESPFVSADERLGWTEGVEVPVLEEGQSVEYLYWVGCINNSDKRKQSIARSMAAILNASGKSWGILGKAECCTGDPARRLGDELQFQSFCSKNVETLSRYNFKRIVVNCPHCLNSLGQDYQFLKTYNVVHHTELIPELIKEGVLKLKSDFNEHVTYHDPCYLARYRGVVEEPREVLVQLGSRPAEMKSSKESGLCCGAGGGHFWMDNKKGERINVLRVQQALDTNSDSLVTSCPFCMHMLDDAAKLVDGGESLEIKDIAELVAQSLETVHGI